MATSIWSVAECNTYISDLKAKLVDALGMATEESFKEGNSSYSQKYIVESIQKQIDYFNTQLQIATDIANGTSTVAYIGSREYGV